MTTSDLFPSDAEAGLVDYRSPSLCDGCPLAPTRNGFVPGEGPWDATLVLVGEAPGQEELSQGRPFIGPSGKVIRKGLNPATTYITNLRKCLPPSFETPETREKSIDHCKRAYLQAEFDALRRATFVHCVGGQAARAIVGVESILEGHGAVFTRAEADGMRAEQEASAHLR